MSTIGPMFAASAQLGLGYGERLLTGIAPEQFGRFARAGNSAIESNHPAFIFGHLSLYGCRIVEGAGLDATAVQPTDEFVKLFSHEAKCVDDPDGSIYPPMEQITAAFFNSHRAATDALNGAADEIFAKENPNEKMRGKFPTVGAMFGFYVGGHVMMHIGQLSAWRRAMGLGPA